jgi:HK97 family phage prohead protease
MPMNKNMQIKQLTTTIEQDNGEDVVAKITTDAVDRDGEVLIPQGMNSKEFEKNPVLFYNHDYAQPIGTVSDLKRQNKHITGKLKFAQRPEDYQGDFFPSFVEALVKQGIVKGVSVGFVPEVNGARAATKADRSSFGSRIKRVYNKWKLLEVSVAPLPANQDALIGAVGKGLVTSTQVKSFLNIDLPEIGDRTVIRLRSRRKIKLNAPDKIQDKVDELVEKRVEKIRGRLYL